MGGGASSNPTVWVSIRVEDYIQILENPTSSKRMKHLGPPLGRRISFGQIPPIPLLVGD